MDHTPHTVDTAMGFNSLKMKLMTMLRSLGETPEHNTRSLRIKRTVKLWLWFHVRGHCRFPNVRWRFCRFRRRWYSPSEQSIVHDVQMEIEVNFRGQLLQQIHRQAVTASCSTSKVNRINIVRTLLQKPLILNAYYRYSGYFWRMDLGKQRLRGALRRSRQWCVHVRV